MEPVKRIRVRREQTPLEVLARDHNWRQGSLKRLLENIKLLRDPQDYGAALQAVVNEIKRTRAAYEAAKAEIMKK